jgi:ribosomal-protein-serine acetyltransferase
MFELRVNENVVLRLRDESHAQETFDLIRSNPQLREWMQWYDMVRTVEDSINNIETNIDEWAMKTDLHLGIFYRERVVGMISLHSISTLANKAAIGYWIAATHEGAGIVTASVLALLDYGFNELGLNKIEIGAAVSNEKSRRIPEKLGFKLDGICRENLLLNGRYHDMALYSLLKREHTNTK